MSERNVVRAFRVADEAPRSQPAADGSDPSTAEGLQLFRAFASIKDTALRRSILNMIEVLAVEARR